MKERKFKTFWLPLFLFAAAIICFYKTLDKFPDVWHFFLRFLGIFSPIVVAVVIAFLLYIPQNAIENLFKKTKDSNFWHKHSRGASVAITYILIIGLFALVVYFIVPALVSNAAKLVKNLPDYYYNTINYIKSLGGQDGKIWGIDVSNIEKMVSLDNILSFFDFSSVGKYLNEIAKLGSGALNFLLSVVMSVYMLCSHEKLILTFGRVLNIVFKKKTLFIVYSYVARGCEIFYDYLYGAFLDAIIVSVEMSIAFSIAQIPYAILLGIFVGLFNLIPYFGSIISCIITVAITFITTGNWVTALIVFAIILVLQQIDANLVQPRVIGNSVGVKPFYVVVAITLGGALFGFIGILVSVPATAFIRMVIIDYMRDHKDKISAKELK